MPANHRHHDLCTGHGCWPPRPNATASPDVFVNARAQHRLGDQWQSHCCVGCHGGYLVSGSKTVFANGLEKARIGDPVSCGSRCRDGSPDTYTGG